MQTHIHPKLTSDDNPEWTAEEVQNAVTFSGLPETLQAKLRRGRGKQKTATKERVNIRLSPDVLSAFRSTGAGWQTRLDALLREWVQAGRV